jgi:hypothetical protein
MVCLTRLDEDENLAGCTSGIGCCDKRHMNMTHEWLVRVLENCRGLPKDLDNALALHIHLQKVHS